MVSKRPYQKWFTILNGLEAELRKSFPEREDYSPKLHGKIPANPGKKMGNELRSVRATLRNLKKGEA